jgi:hypothetical protein
VPQLPVLFNVASFQECFLKSNKSRRPDPYHTTKVANYDQLCLLLDPPLKLLPAALSDFGSIGRELYSAIIQPHFQQLYEAEVDEGKIVGLGRAEGEAAPVPAHQRHSRNGNFRILATMHHEWRARARVRFGPHLAVLPISFRNRLPAGPFQRIRGSRKRRDGLARAPHQHRRQAP